MKKQSALDVQVGGGHYKKFPIQPVEFCQINKIPFCESSVIKYVVRHGFKNGLEDLEKAKHFIDLCIQIEYGSPEEKREAALEIQQLQEEDASTFQTEFSDHLLNATKEFISGKFGTDAAAEFLQNCFGENAFDEDEHEADLDNELDLDFQAENLTQADGVAELPPEIPNGGLGIKDNGFVAVDTIETKDKYSISIKATTPELAIAKLKSFLGPVMAKRIVDEAWSYSKAQGLTLTIERKGLQ